MRTLLSQIYEPGQFHANALAQKRGLREALAHYGAIHDFDYLANDRATLYQGYINRIESFQPDLVLTQFHGADLLTPAQLRELKQTYPGIVWANLSGDSWLHSLTAPPILDLAHEYDLWLVCAPDVLPFYAQEGIHAHFWQIAYEYPLLPLPAMPAYDVVFLGNVISEKRRELLKLLRTLDVSVGIYGDWEGADGHNTYDFRAGEALYQNASLAIADCAYPDQANYISNRPFQCLGAGGALLLHQRVERMAALSGLSGGVHYIEWNTLDELPALIDFWLKYDQAWEKHRITQAGQRFVHYYHTWEARAKQLVEEFLPEVRAKA